MGRDCTRGLWVESPPLRRVRRLLIRLDPLVQLGLLFALAEAYRLLRRLIPTDWPQAIANAHQVERLEQAAHFAWEEGVQDWFLRFPELVKGLNWFYLSSHFVVTGAFFVWLYWRDREGFSIFRDGFLLATAIALLIHWRYPTAPPRLAGTGIKDTIDLYSGFNIGKPHHERFSNPVAAVPSLHAGWALAVGVGFVLYARNVFLKAFGVFYPAAVMLTIVVTGNHYVFDAVAGALVMALGFAATAPFRVTSREPAYARSQ
jgi:membrane-associated phospholipid phosphatase